jgi:hypothetical protein
MGLQKYFVEALEKQRLKSKCQAMYMWLKEVIYG